MYMTEAVVGMISNLRHAGVVPAYGSAMLMTWINREGAREQKRWDRGGSFVNFERRKGVVYE
jgi:hypothetical protein